MYDETTKERAQNNRRQNPSHVLAETLWVCDRNGSLYQYFWRTGQSQGQRKVTTNWKTRITERRGNQDGKSGLAWYIQDFLLSKVIKLRTDGWVQPKCNIWKGSGRSKIPKPNPAAKSSHQKSASRVLRIIGHLMRPETRDYKARTGSRSSPT